ncbi:MAG: YceI family protein [Candidatus Binataceae bacterium]
MKTPRKIGPVLVAALVAFQGIARAASASAGKWAVVAFDPAKTTISYKLIGWPHVSRGTFKLKSGTIRVDPASGRMAGLIVVDAASGSSGHSIRDARMKRDVLEVRRFPEITFAPQQVESYGHPCGESHTRVADSSTPLACGSADAGAFPAVIRGIMALHGTTHPFTMAVTVERQGELVTIRSSFTIPYVAWGLKNPSILFFAVAKVVTVRVSAVASLSWNPS